MNPTSLLQKQRREQVFQIHSNPDITFICIADCRLPHFVSKQEHKSNIISSEGYWDSLRFEIDVPLLRKS